MRQTQKMDAIGQLAGGIAHDFNNLLTAILGYSDWLAQDFRADDPRRVQVAEIQRAGERAAGLTQQLLAFSRRQELDRTPINLSQLVKETVPSLRAVVGDQIEIAGNVDPDVAPIVADRAADRTDPRQPGAERARRDAGRRTAADPHRERLPR